MMCFKNNRKEVDKEHDVLIEEMLKKISISNKNSYFCRNLSSYRSEALRNSHYYGNLRIKYMGFNFSLLAMFGAYLGIYLNLVSSLNSWWVGLLSLFLSMIPYFIYFGKVMLDKSYTISFEHSNLSHFNDFNINSPKISIKNCFKKFEDLIKLNDENFMKNDLKTLLKLYFYQANYKKIGENLRLCLYIGIILFFVGIVLSIISIPIYDFFTK